MAHLLLCNDDGIDSHFLRLMAEVLSGRHQISIAAPRREQSWIGKAMSRFREVQVLPREDFPGPAWSIDGTPADCVNIALGRLLAEPPEAVVSGVNIGINATLPLILNSGTVGGALEGALSGLPALALSQQIAPGGFDMVSRAGGETGGQMDAAVRASVGRVAELIPEILARPRQGRLYVHNFNFPWSANSDTPVRRTVPAVFSHTCLYRSDDGGATYHFEFSSGQEHPQAALTDVRCLAEGAISYSCLDYSAIGAKK